MSAYHYPFDSELARQVVKTRAEGKTIEEWHRPGTDIAQIVSTLTGTILELAGPSDLGYYFLENVALASPVRITNISRDWLLDDSKAKELYGYIDQLVDGRHIPYPDDSLGMVLSSHLPLVDEQKYDLTHLDENQEKQWNAEIEAAQRAITHAISIGEVNDEAIERSLRLSIAIEVFRVLQPGGIYMTDGTEQELKAYEMLGFTKLATIDRSQLDNDTPYYDAVLQK